MHNNYDKNEVILKSNKIIQLLKEAAENYKVDISDNKKVFNYLTSEQFLDSISSKTYDISAQVAVTNVLSGIFPDEPPTYVGSYFYFAICALNNVKEITLNEQKVKELATATNTHPNSIYDSSYILDAVSEPYDFDKIILNCSYDDFDAAFDIGYLNRNTTISAKSIVLNAPTKSIQYFFRNCSLIILGSNIKELPLKIAREYYYAGSMINFKDDPVTLDVTHMTSTEAIKVPVKLIAQMIDENIIIQRRQGQKLLIPKVLAESISSYIKTI